MFPFRIPKTMPEFLAQVSALIATVVTVLDAFGVVEFVPVV